MVHYIFSALQFFCSAFSRSSAWLIFCLVIPAFMASHEMIGISSICRYWGLGENEYHSFLHFFRSSAWSLSTILQQWSSFVLSQNVAVTAGGRTVILGDHTLVAKDGRRMPGVVTLHQKSETQTKPSHFRGHCQGAIGLLIGSLEASFCLPLDIRIHQGLVHIGREQDKESIGTRIVLMCMEFAKRHDLPCTLVLDAFFPSGTVFKLAESLWSIALKQPLVTLIIRAKSNCTAYREPCSSGPRKPGRPRKYGEKVHLKKLFDNPDGFTKTFCRVYGKIEEVSIMAINLVWKPALSPIRFILAVSSRGPIILMCSDLNQNPVIALELYCSRTRIEIMFDMLKNLISAFSYRFWSKMQARHSRRPGKNADMKAPSEQALPVIQNCWDAVEKFVMCGAISLGLLQLVALKFTDSVWGEFGAFMRTRSREIPSERTVRQVVSRQLAKDFHSSAPEAILQKIRMRFFAKKSPPGPT